ncbi:nucleoside recognition domain-containing protein [Negativibacillus massiliensis]|uniref:spore maturation protein n=1 Tax=Negativibacillus massiliensis TaxID=1871035 RepID=UPI002A7EE776|nr:nucleoside recognition domain-containing protein [Negativibacillus massiliensis]MDY4048487.1 spore maturation protein [Negativibacillus massiliensis]
MSFLSSFMIPLLICLIFAYALTHKVDLVSAFSTGVCDGLKIVLNMFPTLLLLTLTINAFRSSGALELLSRALEAPAAVLGIPSPILPLTLLRPLSGSGALVVFENILTQYGPDSLIGKIASVMMGSTETTFYTIALYCSAANIKKSRYAVPASLCADLMGFCASVLAVKLLIN